MERINLRNFTKHPVRIHTADGILEIPSEGEARVAVETTSLGDIEVDNHRVDIVERRFGKVEGLPQAEVGTVFIVSSLVMSHISVFRDDLVAPDTGPGSVIRDDDGNIVGVKRLTRDA